MLVALIASGSAAAATFTVKSTGDASDSDWPDRPTDRRCDVDLATAGKQCTLRAAIQEANSTDRADTIEFDIPGGGVQTITPGSKLPSIVLGRATINGYTQPGATPNTVADPTATNATIAIQITGQYAGLEFDDASGSVVKGLSIGGCNPDCGTRGIYLDNGGGYRVQGNFLGAAADGTTSAPNYSGVTAGGTEGIRVGGGKPAARNLISGNRSLGVYLSNGVTDSLVKGNLIGLDRNGAPLGNGHAPLTGSAFGGVLLIGFGGNTFLSNAIYANGGLGINLGGLPQDSNGVNPNDGDDPGTPSLDPDTDTGPNRRQNFPVLTGAQLFEDPFGDTALGGGTLDSVRSTRKREEEYIIEFFVSPAQDASGYGEGRVPAGQIVVTTDDRGHASFNFSVGGGVDEGDFITATATRVRTGDTSEFSDAVVVQPPVIGP